MTELEIEQKDREAIENALRQVIKFIDPKPPAKPVLLLSHAQVEEFSLLLKEAYRCLWSQHPG